VQAVVAGPHFEKIGKRERLPGVAVPADDSGRLEHRVEDCLFGGLDDGLEERRECFAAQGAAGFELDFEQGCP